MTTFESNNDHHEIVFVSIPKLGEDPSTADSLNNLADHPTTTEQSKDPASVVDSASTFAAAASAIDHRVEDKKMYSNSQIAETHCVTN